MKKLTQEQFGKIMVEVFKIRHYSPFLRLGQCVFNVTYEQYPEIADEVRATGADCFYNDEKIHHFIEAVVEKS